ncbi:MAG: hypothetical protein ACREDG_03040, partial [Methylocella sp.]
YDPLEHKALRGPVEALGLGFNLKPGDLAARCNFCITDSEGVVLDRRAGRISTAHSRRIVEGLQEKIRMIDDVEVTFLPGREHRFAVVFHGNDLQGPLSDSDPLQSGLAPLNVSALRNSGKSIRAAGVVNQFIAKCRDELRSSESANHILVRGIDNPLQLPSFESRFGLAAAAIAAYPAYKGVARMLGMDVLEVKGTEYSDEVAALEVDFVAEPHSFHYIHFKKPDSLGEDGDFDGKVRELEIIDRHLQPIVALKPDVICVTGDHSTPAVMKSHSWHPVPFLICSDRVRSDADTKFGEAHCATGGLGRIRGVDLMPLLLANAGKFKRFSA